MKDRQLKVVLAGIVVLFWAIIGCGIWAYFHFEKVRERETCTAVVRISDKGSPKKYADIITTEDHWSAVSGLGSDVVIDRVLRRLTEEEVKQVIAPYEKKHGKEEISPVVALGKNRRIWPIKLSLFVDVSYRNPNRVIAAKVANLFAEEGCAYLAEEKKKALQEMGEEIENIRGFVVSKQATP